MPDKRRVIPTGRKNGIMRALTIIAGLDPVMMRGARPGSLFRPFGLTGPFGAWVGRTAGSESTYTHTNGRND